MLKERRSPSDQPAPSTGERRRMARSLLAAILPPLTAFVVQSILWPTISPFAWLFFYPAVFTSSWLGGFHGGVGATLMSAALAWWRFIPPERLLIKDDPKYLLSIGIFVATGLAFSVLHESLRRAHREVATTLATSRRASFAEADRDAIREREERFALALKGADLAAWDWNIETGEVIFNPRWAEMRGFRLEEIRPHVDSWITGVHPDDLPHVQKTLEDHFNGLTEYETEHRVSTKSGEWIWILDRGRVFARDARGQPTRMVGTELDVTERKRAEQALRMAYHAAQRATQARDDVLGVVAHDLRNPLGTILMQALVLRRRGGEPEHGYQLAAERIERAAKRMNRLIQDLLDVARMEAGRLSVEQGRMSAGQLVSDSLEAQQPLAAPASLELRADVALELPDIWGDRDRLLQVFENLIGNALKFTEAGGRITVGAATRDGEVLFWVADTGAGVAPENLPHLFDRFWQAEKGGRRGAGLGLPIVKGIVEAHGGRIWVESTPGRGSTFFFTIPTASRAKQGRLEPTSRCA